MQLLQINDGYRSHAIRIPDWRIDHLINAEAGYDFRMLIIVSTALLGIAAVAVWIIRRSPSRSDKRLAGSAIEQEQAAQPLEEPTPYSTEATERVHADCFRLAFGVARVDYQIMGDHATVLQDVTASIDSSVHQKEYFPRRPMLLPKLLRAINDSDSTRQELVRLILEDPALAGNVLQRANTAYYRVSPEPVESIDRAVVQLGMDGLRSLMSTAILQPVFKLPQGFFDSFASVTWEQAQRTAAAAEAYAKATRSTDPFVAQLLGVLGALAHIVLFRLTMQKYRDKANIMPRAEVFIHAMEVHGSHVASLIASTWELSDISLTALNEQQTKVAPNRMSPLGRAVYFGNFCGALALLARHDAYSVDGARDLLMQQGLNLESTDAMWRAALAAEGAG